MKTQKDFLNPHGTGNDVSEKSQIYLQEQFVKQVKDDSLPAHQVLTDQNEVLQNEDNTPDNSGPLFVP